MAETVASIDEWGIDPFSVKLFNDVDGSDVTYVRIDASMEGNPQLLSFLQYGSNAYWNMILVANGLIHPSELVAGMLVALPIRRPVASKKKIRRTQI